MRHILPAQSVQAILDSFQAVGVDLAELKGLLKEASEGVSSETWGVVAGVETLTRLWSQARKQSEEPHFFVRAGLAVPFGSFGLFDHLFMSAPSAGEGLRLLQKFLPLISSTSVLDFACEGDEIELRLYNRPYLYPIHDWVDRWLFGLFVQRFREFAAEGEVLRSAFLRPLAQPDPTLDELVGVSVLPNPLFSGVRVSAAFWERPFVSHDPVLHKALLSATEALMLQHFAQSPIAHGVWNVLSFALHSGQSTSRAVAAQLGISTRTLQRRLQKEKQSLSVLLEAYRKHEALRMLRERAFSVGKIASVLGYNEQSSFNRSFKRWTGTTPRTWLLGFFREEKTVGED